MLQKTRPITTNSRGRAGPQVPATKHDPPPPHRPLSRVIAAKRAAESQQVPCAKAALRRSGEHPASQPNPAEIPQPTHPSLAAITGPARHSAPPPASAPRRHAAAREGRRPVANSLTLALRPEPGHEHWPLHQDQRRNQVAPPPSQLRTSSVAPARGARDTPPTAAEPWSAAVAPRNAAANGAGRVRDRDLARARP